MGNENRYLNYFLSKFPEFEKFYNQTALFDKIKKVARKVGLKIIYPVVVLYYASFDKSIPLKERMLIIAALGYFICPLDLLPDALPGGFADDAAAIAYVVKHVWSHITPEILQKAKSRLREWFGDIDDKDLKIPLLDS